jgi:LIVCS family branched-chain amino acid:cation transporter
MKLSRIAPVLSTALALFAMLFGSGNIAFPLGLGRDLGEMAWYAMIGFFVTAAVVPVLGIIAMALYQGSYRNFMEPIGRIPATLVIFICFALIGPFCIIPRCIAFSHQALQWLIPSFGLLPFTLITAIVLLLTTLRKSGVIEIMGKFLGPLKLGLLTAVILKGLVAVPRVSACSLAGWESFTQGIFVGYGTLDLLGVIFTSGLLMASLTYDSTGRSRTRREMIIILLQAGVLAAVLLGVLYAGFVIVASMQSAAQECVGVAEAKLLSVLAAILLGAGGGVLASITTIVACSTTAIGLTTIFAEYLSTESRGVLSYKWGVIVTVLIATFFANYGPEGIKSIIAPVVMILYPALIVLAIANIVAKTTRFNFIKIPFYATIALALFLKFIR